MKKGNQILSKFYKLHKNRRTKKTSSIFLAIFLAIFCNSGFSIAQDYHDNFQDNGSKILRNGLKLLDSGKLQEAKLLLKKIPSREFHLFSSLCHFYEGSYKNAIDDLKGMDINSSQLVFLNYLEKLNKLTGKFKSYTVGNFEFRLSAEDSILTNYVRDDFDKIYKQIGKEFNYYPQDKIIVEVYLTKEDFAFASTLGGETVERSGAIGICKYNRIMITSPVCLPQGYRWKDTICHEYTHFVLNRITNANCPLWLHEGISRYYETSWRSNPPLYITPGEINTLVDALKNNTLITFARMSPSMVYLKNQDEVSLAFTEVSNSIDFMNNTYTGKLHEIIQNLAKYKEKKAFKKSLGMDISKFEQKWLKYVKSLSLEKSEGVLDNKVRWNKYDEVDEFVGIQARDYIRLGDKFRMNNNFTVALEEYNKGLKLEPFNPVILVKQARTLIALGRIDEAKESLKLCAVKNPNYVTGYEALGELYIAAGQYDEAVKTLNEAVDINPYNPFTQANLAKATEVQKTSSK